MTIYDTEEDDRIFPEEAARVQVLQAMFQVDAMVKDDGAWQLLMDRAFDDATQAIDTLIRGNFEKIEDVRAAQWEVRRYELLAGYINGIAREATEEIDEAEADARRQNLDFIQGEEDYIDG